MKKIYYLILLTFIVASCGKKIPAELRFTDGFPYKVVKIDYLNQVDYKGKCLYIIETGVDHLDFIDNFSVVDSIGKFNINDEIIFKIKKVK